MHEHFDPRLLAFLRDPASYPHRPREIREVHTHASLVFVVPPLVYKIKKPVDFGFLDFSTLAKRRYFCQREVELNSRLAPGIYLGVVPITRQGDGFAFGGDGQVIEHAVRMRELPTAGFLGERLNAGAAGEPEIERVAAVLADFYQKQPSTPEIAEWGSIEKLRLSTDENFSQTAAFIGNTISRAAFDAIRRFTDSCYEKRRALFEQRVRDGWIRDCHGDLHLDHIHVTDDAVLIYDCIEFNDRFRHLDVASDVAFLAMDLDYHGWPELARLLVRRVAGLLGDVRFGALMDFHQCYRVYVRGKVESLHTLAEMADEEERGLAAAHARRYFQLALQYAVAGTSPVALVIIGRVASGKSTLAAALAHELGWHVISSDECRKTLAGVPPRERGDARCREVLYSTVMTERTYDSMLREAREILAGGHCVILDATFSRRFLRDRLRETLSDDHVKWIIAEVDAATASKRLLLRDSRNDVVSDARSGDQPMLDAAFEPPDELPPETTRRISTAGPPDDVVGRVLAGFF